MGLIKKLIKLIAGDKINNLKGEIGEAKVNRKLNPILFNKVEHRQINNLTLVDKSGKTHQIDHIEIRENGIFCIETKNYIGWIFGSENQEKWTQTLYNGEKNNFYNPIKQNNSHVYHLSLALEKKYKINSLVVMVNNNSGNIDSEKVVDLNNLKTYLKEFYDGTHYTTDQMDEIYNELLKINNTQISKKEHIENIKKTQEEIRQGICPRCGGKLIERNSQYGKFYGCSNYPRCKFILKNN